LKKITLTLSAVLGLAILGAIVSSAYAIYNGRSWLPWQTGYGFRMTPTSAKHPPCVSDANNFTWAFKRGWKWILGNKYCKGFRGVEIELSEGFKSKVLEIASNDTDVQNLLSKGYNVSDIKPIHMKLTVQENGQVTAQVDKVLLTLIKEGGYNRAFVEVDLKEGKVVKITIVSVTVNDKSTSP
jgi:hypothetical protein